MKSCGICSHPERAAIDAAMVDGASLRAISGQYGTSKSALDRHRKCIPAALAKAKQAVEVADATSLLSRIERLVSRCEIICEKAMAEGSWTPAIGATRELRSCLELIGKLSGEIKRPGVNVDVDINTSFANVSVKDFSDQQIRDVLDLLLEDIDLDDDEPPPIELTDVERAIRAGCAADSDTVRRALADKERAIADRERAITEYESRQSARPVKTIQGGR